MTKFFRLLDISDSPESKKRRSNSTENNQENEEVLSADMMKRCLNDELQAFKHIETPNCCTPIYLYFVDSARARRLRNMMRKSNSRVTKELDLQKFIHR